MSSLNSAVCLSCGRIGNKIEMDRVVESGFVKGYRHKDCKSDLHVTSSTSSTSFSDWTHIHIGDSMRKNVYDW